MDVISHSNILSVFRNTLNQAKHSSSANRHTYSDFNMPLIKTTLQNQVFTITLNRADKYNSFTEPMALKLQDALKKAASEDVRCVVLNANGKAFSAGQDLPEVVDKAKDEQYELADTVQTNYNPVIRSIRTLKKPVICAVQGTAAGAGANIAFACDIVIASKQAVFVQAFSKIGLIPDSGGTWFLPRLAGLARTNAMYLLDEKITAEKAAEIGLIYKTVDHSELEQVVNAVSKKLSSLPTKGFGLYKKAINKTFVNTLEEQLSLEAELQTEAGNSDDYKEGVTAFLEKRKPKFKGE